MERDVKIAAIQSSFKAMLAKGWFSICEVEQAAELMGVAFTSEQKAFLSLLHCVPFADMTPPVRAELQGILEEVFSRDAFVIVVGKTLLGRVKTKRLTIASS